MKIISADYVLTMDDMQTCIHDGAVVIDGATIVQVATAKKFKSSTQRMRFSIMNIVCSCLD